MSTPTLAARARRWLLVFGLVATLALQATPAVANIATLVVEKSGWQTGTVHDGGLGEILCGTDCSGVYEQPCESVDGPGWPVVCELVEVVLTTSVPSGFTPAWSNCTTSTFTTCTVTVGSIGNIETSKTVTVGFTDTQNPTVAVTSPAPDTAVNSAVIAAGASAWDNDVVDRVDFVLKTPMGAIVRTASDTTAPYAAELSTTGLQDGAYGLHATAIDRSGRVSTVAGRAVAIDRVAPSLTISGPGADDPPGAWTRGGQDAQFEIAASDVATSVVSVTCADDGAPVACTGARRATS